MYLFEGEDWLLPHISGELSFPSLEFNQDAKDFQKFPISQWNHIADKFKQLNKDDELFIITGNNLELTGIFVIFVQQTNQFCSCTVTSKKILIY